MHTKDKASKPLQLMSVSKTDLKMGVKIEESAKVFYFF